MTFGVSARDNPFRAERVQSLSYQFSDDIDWATLHSRLAEVGWRGAVVGPKGSGKTTLIEELAIRLEEQGRSVRWLRLREENRDQAVDLIRRLLSDSRETDLLFVDGAEQMNWLTWRRFKRQASRFAGLVITMHRPGRLPTVLECCTTPELLKSLVRRLLPLNDRPAESSLDTLYARHNGNLRLCFRELYDQWSQI